MANDTNNILGLGFQTLAYKLQEKGIQAQGNELADIFVQNSTSNSTTNPIKTSDFASKIANLYGITSNEEILSALENISENDDDIETLSIDDITIQKNIEFDNILKSGAIDNSLINVLDNIISSQQEALNSTKENNGIIAKSWDWFKNTTGIGIGSNKAQDEIDKLTKQLNDLKEGKLELSEVYRSLTGNELNADELEKLYSGNADFSSSKVIKSVSDYTQGQKQVVNTISGVGSALAVTGLVISGIFTGGLSILAAGAICVGAGSAAYMVPQVIDGETEKDGYSSKEIAQDLASGVVSSAINTLGLGAGKALGATLTANATTVLGQKAAQLASSEATALILGDGNALGDYLVNVAFDEEKDFNIDELGNILTTTTASSLVAGASAFGVQSTFGAGLAKATQNSAPMVQIGAKVLSGGLTGAAAGTSAGFSAGSTNYLLTTNNQEITFEDWIKSGCKQALQGTIAGALTGVTFEMIQIASGTQAPNGTKQTNIYKNENGILKEYLDNNGNVLARDISAKDLNSFLKSNEGLVQYNPNSTPFEIEQGARTIRMTCNGVQEVNWWGNGIEASVSINADTFETVNANGLENNEYNVLEGEQTLAINEGEQGLPVIGILPLQQLQFASVSSGIMASANLNNQTLPITTSTGFIQNQPLENSDSNMPSVNLNNSNAKPKEMQETTKEVFDKITNFANDCDVLNEIDLEILEEAFISLQDGGLEKVEAVEKIYKSLIEEYEYSYINFDAISIGIKYLADIIDISYQNSYMLESLVGHSEDGGIFSVEDLKLVDKFFGTIAPMLNNLDTEQVYEILNSIDKKMSDSLTANENLSRITEELEKIAEIYAQEQLSEVLYEHYAKEIPLTEAMKERLYIKRNVGLVCDKLEEKGISLSRNNFLQKLGTTVNELLDRGHTTDDVAEILGTSGVFYKIDAAQADIDPVIMADFLENNLLTYVYDYDIVHRYTASEKVFNDITFDENGNIVEGELYSKADADYLSSVIKQASIQRDMKVYRGEGFGVLDSYKLSDGTSLGRALQEAIASGDTSRLTSIQNELTENNAMITQPRFMSTAYSQSRALNFIKHEGGILWEIEAPKGAHGIYADIFNTTDGNESEMLFDRNTSLIITDAEFKDGIFCIKAELIQG